MMNYWYVNTHAMPNVNEVIKTVEEVKRNGITETIKHLNDNNNCIYVFTDGFEYRGVKLDTETLKTYKATHGKLTICVIK